MSTCDSNLGNLVHNMLVTLGLETPMSDNIGPAEETVKQCHATTMRALGLDLSDDSLADTPKRVAKMYCHEIFTGLNYANFPKCTTVENKAQYDEMVCVDKIQVMSMCEHHFLPFVGTATVAYIPKEKIMGLSKFNRVVDFFSRRPQIQERLTGQIGATLQYILGTDAVAVVIRADHFCVRLRGIKDQNSDTVTSWMRGRFMTVPALRQEFLALSRGGQ